MAKRMLNKKRKQKKQKNQKKQKKILCTSKYRVSFCIRVLLFFGIPIFYFLVNSHNATVEEDNSGLEPSLASRHLLGLIEQGNKNCTPPAILEFPSDGLNRSQRQHGFILIHCVLAVYCFLLLGIICEDYFVPSLEILCERDTLNIPDSITGLTILAAGASLPEAVSSVIVTMQGHGSMGISNTIGSNTFDILLCLGLPWLVKSLIYPSYPDNHWVMINSSGLSYSAISLLSTLLAFYLFLLLNKFQLDWKVGLSYAVVYAGFLVMAAMIELNVLFPVNLPIRPHS
ncbi:sodium/potassium/calcium exchanger 5-like [Maniola jurtina]|uniref:sodium/potassium/calcium exchanger 5-like n=1 Tax=Maniola jurtina TaxID=191418 RepID=UPI001E68A8EA|nr:sodium/potassium/calcium exchanger 5-like [Maniola jurtina]